MPAFSHCFLKRFMAFSNDSPSLTRTPGILGITTFRPAEGLACRGRPAKTRQYRRRQGAVKPTRAASVTICTTWKSENSVRQGMSEAARLSVTLPEYETELAVNQRKALRAAALLAAPILLGFTVLDWSTARDFWMPLLAIRAAAAAGLMLVGVFA